MEYEDSINAVATRAKVSPDQAATLTGVTLETFAQRINVPVERPTRGQRPRRGCVE